MGIFGGMDIKNWILVLKADSLWTIITILQLCCILIHFSPKTNSNCRTIIDVFASETL